MDGEWCNESGDRLRWGFGLFPHGGCPAVASPRVAKSIDLANKEDYLDQPWEVYPLELEGEVPLTPALMAEITKVHDDASLIGSVRTRL